MSTMKSFITTLDLVMQDKVEPETVVEEDEIEETLTINEDGEIVDENLLTDKLKAVESAVLSATDIIMGGKYDESVEQEWKAFDDLYENIKQTNKLKVMSGQQLDEAFTRQHFELFAGMLKNISDDGARNDYAGRLVAMFEKDNPRFNKEQFLQAAGIDTADEKTELVYDETGKVHQIRPSEVDAFLQGHPGRGLAEGAVNEIWAPSKEIDDMEFPTTGVKDGWKKGDSEELVSSDWGSSDWTVAMEAMWDSLLRQHDGKVTPETMEAAAEEVIMAHGEQMGYDEGSFGEGVSQVISMFLNRQDGIKDSNMIGLANDTHRYAGKTKYMK